ncbi:Allantoicase [Podila verticillata]|nr:Allantoicase [Podila verticillata]
MGQVQSRQDESYFKLESSDKAALEKYIDLASANKGGKVLKTSDELFGEGFHLIKDGPAIEDKNRETANGFWKDGWETRRHNKDSHHTATIQLASAGTIAGFDVDTSFFDGSHPAFASIEACLIVKGEEDYQWRELLPKIPLSGNSHHYYGLQASDEIYTHVRLNMYPDGGIARLRVFGNISPIFPKDGAVFDLASLASGGVVVKSSDDRYGKPSNIILPVPGVNTRDGWQTRRSRVEGHHDWVEIKLGAAGQLKQVEVDTTHFRGNNPDFISLDACKSEYKDVQYDPEVKWVQLLSKTDIESDKKNIFELSSTNDAYTHVRLNIYPDGGISRLRVYGVRVPETELETSEVTTAVEGLKMVDTSALSGLSSVTLVELNERETVEVEEEETKAGKDVKATLISEVSSVTTLVENDTEEVEEEPVKRTNKRGGRAKAAGAAAVAAVKLTAAAKKKTKGRSASVLDEDEDATTSSPRTKRSRE